MKNWTINVSNQNVFGYSSACWDKEPGCDVRKSHGKQASEWRGYTHTLLNPPTLASGYQQRVFLATTSQTVHCVLLLPFLNKLKWSTHWKAFLSQSCPKQIFCFGEHHSLHTSWGKTNRLSCLTSCWMSLVYPAPKKTSKSSEEHFLSTTTETFTVGLVTMPLMEYSSLMLALWWKRWYLHIPLSTYTVCSMCCYISRHIPSFISHLCSNGRGCCVKTHHH